jgi:hypothetical protein
VKVQVQVRVKVKVFSQYLWELRSALFISMYELEAPKIVYDRNFYKYFSKKKFRDLHITVLFTFIVHTSQPDNTREKPDT